MEISSANEMFLLAADIVRNTSKAVFLTGKAGTGKTTFLHYIRNNVDKNVIVAAPTGVAAINAGGVTLHSLLQLPFEPFIPTFEGKKKLDFHFKLRKSKIEMLRELDLLVIDEVSMLRADMLDAIDYMLKRYRNNQDAFGGVQILFIGDMFQLPPVVQQQEWENLKHFYPSPFFYDALALQDNIPLYIELKTIYRQSDQVFIDILNNIRNNCATSADFEIINRRYDPTFKLNEQKGYIVLSTHNHKVDKINKEELLRLDSAEYSFSGKITGDFADNSLPTDLNLSLKKGAQIMFVKNDAGERKRYYNGKLGLVSSLSKDKVKVQFDNGNEMELEKETWRNIRYKLNEDSGNIQEEELGTYTQYPIRLAWAVTIHKSQGLTFDRVVIDAGQAFAAGQVYVAFSRCRSLDGIVLFSRITPESIRTDEGTLAFAKQELKKEYLQQVLDQEKPKHCADQLIKAFDWMPVVRNLRSFYELVSEKKIPNKDEVQSIASILYNHGLEEQVIAQNFIKELSILLAIPNPNIDMLKERVGKAASYFHKDIQAKIILPLEQHISTLKNASKVKLYLRGVSEIYSNLLSFLQKLEHIHYGNIDLTKEINFERLSLPKTEKIVEEKAKASKGETQRITLSLFEEGRSIKEIAAERNLSVITIEGHLSGFVLSGELSIDRLMSEDNKNFLIRELMNNSLDTPLSSLKESLPEQYSYFEIKIIINHLKWISQK